MFCLRKKLHIIHSCVLLISVFAVNGFCLFVFFGHFWPYCDRLFQDHIKSYFLDFLSNSLFACIFSIAKGP